MTWWKRRGYKERTGRQRRLDAEEEEEKEDE